MTDRPFNTVALNLGPDGTTTTAPEPNIAPVMIDGYPVHNVADVHISAGVGQLTKVVLVFYAKVGGFAPNAGTVERHAKDHGE